MNCGTKNVEYIKLNETLRNRNEYHVHFTFIAILLVRDLKYENSDYMAFIDLFKNMYLLKFKNLIHGEKRFVLT